MPANGNLTRSDDVAPVLEALDRIAVKIESEAGALPSGPIRSGLEEMVATIRRTVPERAQDDER
jgi:hypothetical protein